ncbi:glycosyltransferase family 4 protein [Nitrospira sp. Nam80]
MRTVSIIQREIPHYRVRLFEELYAQGQSQGLDIKVYTAAPPPNSQTSPDFPYCVLPVRRFGNSKSSSYWIYGLKKAILGSDIVVAPQELQCLTVPYLWARRKRICKNWIWWGHGYNHQASVNPSLSTTIKEVIKQFMTRRADGLITYTAKGAEYWRQRGFPKDRVIPYFNTIDVEGLRNAAKEISEDQLSHVRQKIGTEGKQVLLFSGRLYAEKKVDFLIRAFAILKKAHPAVVLLIIGDGEERGKLEGLVAQLDVRDVHFLGEVIDPKETAVYFLLSDLMVVPGLVGLVIVHGFAYGLPMITTEHSVHSFEVEYLSNKNGVITSKSETRYADAIREILSSEPRLRTMRKAAKRDADRLSLALSAQRFVNGMIAFHNTDSTIPLP